MTEKERFPTLSRVKLAIGISAMFALLVFISVHLLLASKIETSEYSKSMILSQVPYYLTPLQYLIANAALVIFFVLVLSGLCIGTYMHDVLKDDT